MAERTWQPFPGEDCDACGSDVEVFTDAVDGAHDGDPVRCAECGFTGCIAVDEDWDEENDELVGEASIDWDWDEWEASQ